MNIKSDQSFRGSFIPIASDTVGITPNGPFSQGSSPSQQRSGYRPVFLLGVGASVSVRPLAAVASAPRTCRNSATLYIALPVAVASRTSSNLPVLTS